MNLVIVMGNLTKDPILSYTPNGNALVNFTVAVNSKYKPKGGEEYKDEVDFFQITAWNKTAENCAEYLNKGSKVLVQGKLKQDTWEKDGQKHSKIKIVANDVRFLDGKKETKRITEDNSPLEGDEIPF